MILTKLFDQASSQLKPNKPIPAQNRKESEAIIKDIKSGKMKEPGGPTGV